MVLTEKNAKYQLKNPETDPRYPVYECNNRIGDLLFLLSFCNKNINVRLISQRYTIFYLINVRYLVFYTGMILNRHL